jgi:hypothetical protein
VSQDALNYERFPAKGQIERVARIHRELGAAARIERRAHKPPFPGSDPVAPPEKPAMLPVLSFPDPLTSPPRGVCGR